MALTTIEIRALQALRATGGMTAEQAWERWPTCGAQPFHALRRRGLAACDGGIWTITEAGRAACPKRRIEVLEYLHASPRPRRLPEAPHRSAGVPPRQPTTTTLF